MIDKLRFSVIEKVSLPDSEEKVNKSTKIVDWGNFNDFPQQVYDLYLASSLFTSIATTIKDYTLGDGIDTSIVSDMNTPINRKGDTIEDLITKCIYDRVIFGGFAIQVIRNSFNEIAELNWLDMRNVRVNEDEDTIYYNKKWGNGSRQKPVKYMRYVLGDKQPVSVYYYKGRATRGVYPVPDWIGALKSLKISTEIDNYNLSNITNNFTPSALINFNNGSNISEDVMDEIETKIYDKFISPDSAGRIILSFNDDKEHATEIVRLADDGLENKYNLLKDSMMKNIYSAFRVNPCLLGYNQENMGFNTQEFEGAFKLFNRTVIQPLQKEMVDAFEKLYGRGCLTIEPFTLKFDEVKTVEKTEEIR